MKGSASISITLSLLLAIADWVIGCNQNTTVALATEAPTNTCVFVGRISSVQGIVRLKRQGWSDYHQTAVGAELCLGDLLRPEGATVIVQCADANQTRWTVPDRVTSGVASGCPPPTEPISTPFGPIPPTRGETIASSRIPYIISPRSTLLLNAQPTLRWNAVPGAKSYSVRIRGEGLDWVKPNVTNTSVVYSGEQPLKPGIYYSLIVETDTGRSSFEENVRKLGFQLLDNNQLQQVQAAVNQLVNKKLDEKALTLSLVDLYIKYDLKAEAIETLEPLVKTGSPTAAMYRTLGQLYWRIGVPTLAESPYLNAIELAATEDIEGQAEAAAGLGKTYIALEQTDKAIQYINVALTKYEVLGDSQRISELKNQLAAL